ncbi:Sulfate permease, MFS superfamily [Nannocystis exedens]|uniref:Sulfate permease, MFS superfamily n=1 Tax=Nannocystis exedens TaxID=54 RepID=A0A1I1UYF7_9BACT|nr:membrane protein [Nannocystis exedens]SFD73873.1 Sulfate permease, MFS superfamily [Nannocystis exedens]
MPPLTPDKQPWHTHLAADIPASLVVFLVALPLCLGIALASGAPLLAGLFAGFVGGLVVGTLSGSPLSVSGPAAGLTVVVAAGIAELGAYSAFILAVVLAGVMQLGFGLLRAGAVAHFVPVAVVHGMLAAIGCILVLKQVPHALGYDVDFEGDESFVGQGGGNTFTDIVAAVQNADLGAFIIFVAALGALLLWQKVGKKMVGSWMPPALVAVIVGALTNELFRLYAPDLHLTDATHLVTIPDLSGLSGILFALPFPDFSRIGDPAVWRVAATIAVIASVESLLSVGACDKLDPFHRITPTDRELKAQGAGNIVSGLLGGLPITAVIVRSSANIDAGARTRVSAILHGVLLLLSVLVLAPILNHIPLSALAAVLIVMGLRLASVRVFHAQYQRGKGQFVPFLITLGAILFTDLLVGVAIGVGVGIFYVIRSNFRSAIVVAHEDHEYLIRFAKDVSFLNKPALLRAFSAIPNGSAVLIDGTRAQFIDPDIVDAIDDFLLSAKARNITVELRRSATSLNTHFKQEAAA